MEFRESTEIEKPSSGVAGCLIPVTIVGVLIAMVSWAIYSLVQQDKKIDVFTSQEPAPITAATPTTRETAALDARLDRFASGETLSIELTTAELNALIATRPALAELAPMLAVTTITPEHIAAECAFPMRKLGQEEPRYLNAEIYCVPRVAADGQLFFDLLSLEVPGKTVDPGFVGNYREQRVIDSMVLRPYDTGHPRTAATLAAITEIVLAEGKLTATRSAPAAGEPLENF